MMQRGCSWITQQSFDNLVSRSVSRLAVAHQLKPGWIMDQGAGNCYALLLTA